VKQRRRALYLGIQFLCSGTSGCPYPQEAEAVRPKPVGGGILAVSVPGGVSVPQGVYLYPRRSVHIPKRPMPPPQAAASAIGDLAVGRDKA